jgi:tetratricopeptide (TPR) repeat protein
MAPPGQPSEEYRYELARTYFFLSSRYVTGSASQRGNRDEQPPARLAGSPFPDKEYRKLATRLLEQLTRENPDAADYRFLLAICYLPRGIVPEPERGPGSSRGRDRALEILEALKAEYPQVADYRYELAATYAWVHVGLFPWQGRSIVSPQTDQSLQQALNEAQWLVDHNPSIPHYVRCQALVLAKLGVVREEAGRLAEARDLFEQALQTQTALVVGFPDVPDHDRVLLEFFRLRLAAASLRQNGESTGGVASFEARELLETCVQHLTELMDRPEFADDRLASSSLQIAEDALRRMRRE